MSPAWMPLEGAEDHLPQCVRVPVAFCRVKPPSPLILNCSARSLAGPLDPSKPTTKLPEWLAVGLLPIAIVKSLFAVAPYPKAMLAKLPLAVDWYPMANEWVPLAVFLSPPGIAE